MLKIRVPVRRHNRNVNGRNVNVQRHYRRARKYWLKSQNEVERMLNDKDQEDSNITEFLQITSGESVTDLSTLNDLGSGEGVEIDQTESETIADGTHESGRDGQVINGVDE